MPGRKPLVSFVIPIYNVEKYLRRCLDSVLNQTFTDWEAICVNDGSPDACAEILKEYATIDSRFKVINKENGGLSDARNVGVNAAKGDFIFFLDSDDFIHVQTLEILTALAENKNADMVLFKFDTRFHDCMGKKIRKKEDISNFLPESRKVIYKTNKIKSYITEKLLFHSTERKRTLRVLHPVRRHCYPVLALYRKSLVAEVPFIRGIIMEDFPWWSAIMLRRPKTVMTNLPLYFYVPNVSSILNSSKALRMIESIATGIENVFSLYSAYASDREFKHFNREFLWPFTIIAMRKVKELDNKLDVAVAQRAFENLYKQGVFDKTPTLRARKYRRKIKKFINQNI